jgi:hypothetical protein
MAFNGSTFKAASDPAAQLGESCKKSLWQIPKSPVTVYSRTIFLHQIDVLWTIQITSSNEVI